MGRKPTGRPNGRPRIEIDKRQFETACAMQCTEEEIAALFDCSVATVERWCEREYGVTFAEVYKSKRDKGKISLRRNQFKLSETNATMAIWLGKQWLGQRDRQEDETDTVKLIIERKVIDLTGGEDEDNKL